MKDNTLYIIFLGPFTRTEDMLVPARPTKFALSEGTFSHKVIFQRNASGEFSYEANSKFLLCISIS